MKTPFFIAFLGIFMLISSCSKEKCGSYKSNNGGCTTEISIVCGCDGNTYTNECEAMTAGVIDFTPGRCQN